MGSEKPQKILQKNNFLNYFSYAPVKGMCQKMSSHTLCKEDGFNSVFVIAHETGHVLGMEHDGAGSNVCLNDRRLGSIMAPTVESSFSRYYWSHCSKSELKLNLHHWTCLNNNPNRGPNVGLTIRPEPYDLDQQCKFDFGSQFSLCRSVSTYMERHWQNIFKYRK